MTDDRISVTGFARGGTDTLFRFQGDDVDAQRSTFTCLGGPWLRDEDAGVVRAGLAPALDEATGSIVGTGAEHGRWPVSLSLRLDFLGDPPVDGTPVTVTGALVTTDAQGAITRGEAHTADGTVIALVTHRSHLVNVDHGTLPQQAVPDVPSADITVRTALGFTENKPGQLTMALNPYATNGMGNVHGGVLTVGSELAAHSLFQSGWRTRSIDISFVRPRVGTTPTTFTAELAYLGRSLGVAHVAAHGPDGKVCSMATVTAQPA
ncbi:PaaI family thioesterase [Gordonia alkaliphila]|uniref:Acyl-CoA thioesterase-like N-terminal HotDog domain-containing protein n=1 Tax=Gordonia alkaliphila TaxID=1053547 RepID=A0ABP8ZEU5_9ACTN